MIRGRAIFLACLVALLYWAPQWMPRAAEDTTQEVRRATAAANEERLISEAEKNRATLTPEQRALLDDLQNARSDITRSRVRDKLLGTLDPATRTTTATFYEWAADSWRNAHGAYVEARPRAEHWLWSIVIIIALAGIVTALLSQPGIARIAGRLGVGIARSWLVVLSFVAIAIAMMTRTNPWIGVPDELIFAPIAALAAGAFALRLADFNYPVWNSLIRACGAPVISMAFITAYLKLV